MLKNRGEEKKDEDSHFSTVKILVRINQEGFYRILILHYNWKVKTLWHGNTSQNGLEEE